MRWIVDNFARQPSPPVPRCRSTEPILVADRLDRPLLQINRTDPCCKSTGPTPVADQQDRQAGFGLFC